MFNLTEEALKAKGADITTREIKQQPELWEETYEIYMNHKDELNQFLDDFAAETEGPIRVVFTGGGTSAYAGDTVVPHLNRTGDTKKYIFESLPSTDIVAAPLDYLHPDDPTLLVSFARSGNSPESMAAVEAANKVCKNIRHLAVTCAPEGTLAKMTKEHDNMFLLLMPAGANDQGFAMTGSYSTMSLSVLLIFDAAADDATKKKYVDTMQTMGHEVIAREGDLQQIVDLPFDRIVYLGSGSLSGLTREAQLKVLELTAGKIATVFDSSMGFRHGPKSFLDQDTLVFVFTSNDDYTRQYDIDILNEMHGDDIARNILSISQPNDSLSFEGDQFTFATGAEILPEGYLALPFVMVAQTVALLTSIKVGNTPDTPSPTGTVNRVVKGVIIHEYAE
ncbi:MAG: SIS domain-containing protein [Eubacteriaceae bacterium]|jgi:tagatose-6-phosphate ketose/aldose isomerase